MKPDRGSGQGTNSERALKVTSRVIDIFMDDKSAELTKYAAIHSWRKISFMNEMLNICED